MSEAIDQGGADPGAASPTVVTAGMMLRQARELRGIHVAALAVSIRVPVKKLEALEADRHEQLHDMVFARALAGLVCRALKIDAEPVLQLLPQSDRPILKTDASSINAPFQRPAYDNSLQFWQQIPRPALMAVALLLSGALVLLLLPQIHLDSPLPNPSAPSAALLPPVPEGSTSLTTENSNPSPLPSQEAKDSSTPLSQPLVGMGTGTAVPAQARQASNPSAAESFAVLRFKTRGSSWVRVSDGKGEVLLSRNLGSGEVAEVNTTAFPLQVVIGRVDMTEVWVRGKPLALAEQTRDNVARFEVKP